VNGHQYSNIFIEMQPSAVRIIRINCLISLVKTQTFKLFSKTFKLLVCAVYNSLAPNVSVLWSE